MVAFTAVLAAAFGSLAVAAPTARSINALDVTDKYVVALKSGADVTAHKAFVADIHKRSLERRGATFAGLDREFDFNGFLGYAGHFDAETVKAIQARPDVKYVEAQQLYHTTALVAQNSTPSWGIAYVSVKKPSGSTYYYDSSAGTGVTAYVIDTGINIDHQTFNGRASWGYNAVAGSSNTDKNGHGTHCSGTIAGTQYGIAKLAKLVAVKVLGDTGSGSTAGVIDGINWAVNDITSKGIKGTISMSLGGGFSQAINDAVEKAVDAGINVAVAAGNSAADAKDFSPASAPKVITVGATTKDNALASYSNFGALVDILAPGSNITSSWFSSNTATNTISGTSMATPHIAGLLSYFRSLEGLSAPDAAARLISLATKGAITGVPSGTANLFSYNNSGK